MPGGVATPPPPEVDATSADSDATLRARFRKLEARLTQTETKLTTARQTISAFNAAPPHDAVGDRAAAAGVGTGSRPATGGVPAGDQGDRAVTDRPPLPPTAGGSAPLAAGYAGAGATGDDDAPLGDDEDADYLNPDDGDRESDGAGGWGVARWGRNFSARATLGASDRPTIDEASAYDDGFDFRTSFKSSDWLQSFEIPRSVLRSDGLPMPFTPCDPVHASTFTPGSRDELEARQWYCSLAWTQNVYNDLLAAQHADGNTKELLQELVDYLVCATRRIYALGVSRYDFLALRQSEPKLADAFAHADAVPRNSLRGDGARRFISRVVRAEAAASAKVGAAERGYSYSRRSSTAPTPATRTRSPARRGGGSGSGGGGRGGGGRAGGSGSSGSGGRGRGGGRA